MERENTEKGENKCLIGLWKKKIQKMRKENIKSNYEKRKYRKR